jgi:micrococcal nuclease
MKALLLILILALMTCSATWILDKEVPIHAEVVRVVDGDTIVVRLDDGTEEVVRILGVDTPEMNRWSGEPPEPMAVACTVLAWARFRGAEVWLLGCGKDRDYYGRLLAYVLEDPEDSKEESCGCQLSHLLNP